MADIYLRPLQVKDALVSYKWRNDAEIWKYTGSRPDAEVTPEMECEWARKVISDPSRMNYAICTSEGRYIGNVYLIHIREGVGELGIFIGERACHGCGFGTRALEELKLKARLDLGLDAILINVDERNIPALKTYKKCGAVKIAGGRPLPEGRFWMQIVV